jgi:hypothetical protein
MKVGDLNKINNSPLRNEENKLKSEESENLETIVFEKEQLEKNKLVNVNNSDMYGTEKVANLTEFSNQGVVEENIEDLYSEIVSKESDIPLYTGIKESFKKTYVPGTAALKEFVLSAAGAYYANYIQKFHPTQLLAKNGGGEMKKEAVADLIEFGKVLLKELETL